MVTVIITLSTLLTIAASSHYEAERYYERLAVRSDSDDPQLSYWNTNNHNVWRTDGLIRSNGADIYSDSGFKRDNDVDFSNDVEENYFEHPDFDDNNNDVEENNDSDTEDKKCFRVLSLMLFLNIHNN